MVEQQGRHKSWFKFCTFVSHLLWISLHLLNIACWLMFLWLKITFEISHTLLRVYVFEKSLQIVYISAWYCTKLKVGIMQDQDQAGSETEGGVYNNFVFCCLNTWYFMLLMSFGGFGCFVILFFVFNVGIHEKYGTWLHL